MQAAAVKAAIDKQKREADDVKTGGFPGLEILMRDLARDAQRLTTELIEAKEIDEIRMKQAEVKALKRLVDTYMKYLQVET